MTARLPPVGSRAIVQGVVIAMQVAKAVTSTTRILLLMTVPISPIGALLV